MLRGACSPHRGLDGRQRRGLAEAMESTPTAWSEADAFLSDLLVGPDADLESALSAQREAGLPEIEVAPVAGKLLNLLVRISGARRVLEVGTLGGYSTIWLARAVGPGGRVVTIEAEPDNAAIARASIDAAGVGDRVDIRVGREWMCSPPWSAGSTWCSSTPTRSRTPSTSTGRRSSATPAPWSCSTTSGVRARSSAMTAPTPRSSAPVRDCGCWGGPAIRRHGPADRRREGLGRLRHRRGRLISAASGVCARTCRSGP